MEKLYRVQMNSKGAPDFSTAVEVEDKPSVDKDYLMQLIQEAVYDGEACAKLLDLVDRPQGEWKITDAWPHNVYCSECYKTFAQTRWEVWEDGSLPRKFCPNCGARMKGTDNEQMDI